MENRHNIKRRIFQEEDFLKRQGGRSMGQEKQKRVTQWITAFGMGLCLLLAVFGMQEIMVYAATEPTYEWTDETKEAEAYVGTVNIESLNVRTGFGASFDKVQMNGSIVVLLDGDKVAVMSSGNASNGSLWYEVRWMKNGVEYHGYVNAKYVDISEERAVPLATPTPEATFTPTPTPTPEVTPTPIPETTITPIPTETPEGEGGFKLWEGILLVILILLLIGVLYVLFMMKKRQASATQATEKIDSLKNLQLKKQAERQNAEPVNVMRRKVEVEEAEEQVSRFKEDDYEREAAMLARKEQARIVNEKIVEKSRFFDPTEDQQEERELKQLSESLKEKEVLRDEIDSLRPGDIVYHEFFGKGVVFDNSDVKRIEIRFGTDVRFIDKAGCVAKRLMRKI